MDCCSLTSHIPCCPPHHGTSVARRVHFPGTRRLCLPVLHNPLGYCRAFDHVVRGQQRVAQAPDCPKQCFLNADKDKGRTRRSNVVKGPPSIASGPRCYSEAIVTALSARIAAFTEMEHNFSALTARVCKIETNNTSASNVFGSSRSWPSLEQAP